MNAERAAAYLRLIGVIDTEKGVTIRDQDAAILRHAADALLFDEDGRSEALDAAREVLDQAAESGRWSQERCDRVTADLDGCGALLHA